MQKNYNCKSIINIIQSEINKTIFSTHQTQLIENKTKLHKTQIIQFFVNIKFKRKLLYHVAFRSSKSFSVVGRVFGSSCVQRSTSFFIKGHFTS